MPDARSQPPIPSPVAGPAGRWRRWVVAAFVAGWIGFLAAPPLLLLRSREAWLETLAGGAVQEDWEAFREDMRAQSGRDGPVQHKIPKSPEPPLRVWLRDHVGLAIAAWLVLGGTLGGFLGLMVAGAASYSPNTARAVAATTTNSTSVMPSTPNNENTAGNPREE